MLYFLVQIDKSHIEMYIGVRDKYPMQAPAFLLTFDRQSIKFIKYFRLCCELGSEIVASSAHIS